MGIVATSIDWVYGMAVAVCLGLSLLFAWKPVIGLYAIAILYPFINLQFVYGDLNIPYVDGVALLAFAGWLGRSLWLWVVQGQAMSWKQFPGFVFFLAFVIISFLSATQAEDVASSIKYVLRPLSFFYLMFVIFPLNTISSSQTILRVFKIFYGIGIYTALNGLWGFLTYPTDSILARRAVPAAIFGLFPYGTSHNLIAEVLIAVMPIGLLLVWLSEKEQTRKWLLLGTAFMLGVNLLTFSRTGWITAGFEFFVLGWALYRNRLKEIAKVLVVMGMVFVPVMAYMLIFSAQSFVQSSDENRFLLNHIAFQTWQDFPVLGAGPGRFVEFVKKNTVYTIEFGDASEAHGFIQKIAAEEGTLGLVAYCALLGYVLYSVWKVYSRIPLGTDWKLILLACFIMASASIIFQLFQTNYFVSKLWFPLGLALAAAHVAQREKKVVV